MKVYRFTTLVLIALSVSVVLGRATMWGFFQG